MSGLQAGDWPSHGPPLAFGALGLHGSYPAMEPWQDESLTRRERAPEGRFVHQRRGVEAWRSPGEICSVQPLAVLAEGPTPDRGRWLLRSMVLHSWEAAHGLAMSMFFWVFESVTLFQRMGDKQKPTGPVQGGPCTF